MTDDNVLELNDPGQNDPLEEVLRDGARKMLAAAIESEVASFIDQHGGLKTAEVKRQWLEMAICLSVPFKLGWEILQSKYRKYVTALVLASNSTAA